MLLFRTLVLTIKGKTTNPMQWRQKVPVHKEGKDEAITNICPLPSWQLKNISNKYKSVWITYLQLYFGKNLHCKKISQFTLSLHSKKMQRPASVFYSQKQGQC